MRRAVYPGTFDPVTHGHLDLIERGTALFDHLVIAVARNPEKTPVFTVDERVEMLQDLVGKSKRVSVDSFDGLVVEYMRRKKLQFILRGVRFVSDFEYEFQMALTNRALEPKIDTVFVMPNERYSFVSSRLIKEAVSMGGDVSAFLPRAVERRLRARLRERTRRARS
ncbi:MAG: pantetheine-phosphate adenylyltransferase [Planctomycetes bacterium]|nr:pantetheine-phosphate adenylyltransferase [Planctomycetota bacterium]MBI3845758.1 pantetheine-phosphate adenylyltransferase [Planctomycetota bacterium]